MTRVKICGITNLDDALAATAAGADYLGFIFYPPSKRAITPADAAVITAALRERDDCPQLVGVFVDESGARMAEMMAQCRLDWAQLSGDEVPRLVGDASSPVYGRCFKALRPTTQAEAEAEAEWYYPPDAAGDRPALLMDTYHPTLRGGTGELPDWTIAAALAQTYPGFVLAGGLKPSNVAAAVRAVQPFAVDVASGVEASPGRKDQAAVRAFVAAAKSAGVIINN